MFIKRILVILMVILPVLTVKCQSPFENWSTINLRGKLDENVQIVIEGEQRYNHNNKHIRYFHADIGLLYKINDKFSIGGYYRELYELKDEERVIEIRPHLDFFYKFTDKWGVRIRNEYQIKEKADNVFRFRVRPTYKYKINETFSPFIQTEGFFVGPTLARNRFNPGVAIKLNKIIVEPGYMLESNNRTKWSHIHIFWINVKIKI